MGLIHYENDFSSLIKDKAVADFYATWCGPCKMFGPVFEDASKENEFNFIKLDVDKYSDVAREYGVMSIPTIILFENGKESTIAPIIITARKERDTFFGAER